MKRLVDFLKQQDEFGEDVQLTFKGMNKHGTVFGGICSLLASFLFLSFFA
jgi:hypothetical protein